MLYELEIENFALIVSLRLCLEPGLTVLTGETGAGKSIIVDAVSLLVGARASTEYIRAGAEKALVQGLFQVRDVPGLPELLAELDIPAEADGSLLLSREISRSGRHSCRVNGRGLTLSMYQRVGQMLVDIHGQHAYQSILRPAYQMDLLDNSSGLTALRNQVGERYRSWKLLEKELARLCGDAGERERRRELLTYQFKEITAAGLRRGEDEELYRQREIINNAARLARGAATIYEDLFTAEGRAAYDRISQAAVELAAMATIDSSLQPWQNLLATAAAQVEEVARSIFRYGESLEYDPRQGQQIEERLELIKNLKRKYGADIEAILKYQEETAAALEELEQNAARAAALEQKIAAAAAAYREAALELRRQRLEAAQNLSEAITSVVHELAMPLARVTISCNETGQPGPEGMDAINFLFQPNPGEGSRPLAQIASGGEMARVMLACKSILAAVDAVPTLVFDEIDAGISGAAARAVAQTLAAIAGQHQVLCITHSAQLAAMAGQHYRVTKTVSKGRTSTGVEKLPAEERVEELARLLSGENTPVAREHAAALLIEAGGKRAPAP